MKNETFKYNGADITFLSGDVNIMVNASEMASQFGKQPAHWLRSQQATDFIKQYCDMRNRISDDLVRVTKGGTNQGTWMHEDVALEFARWLSPAFAIWCNDRIKELMKYGMTATQPTLEAMVDNPDLVIGLAQKLKSERAEKQRLLEINQTVQNQLAEQAPSVLFRQAVEGAKSSCLIGELAKIIAQNGVDMGERRLFAWLRENGYLGKHGERYNVPNQQYIEQGLFEIKKGVRSGNGGVLHTTITTKVTGKGQVYFVNKFLKCAS